MQWKKYQVLEYTSVYCRWDRNNLDFSSPWLSELPASALFEMDLLVLSIQLGKLLT